MEGYAKLASLMGKHPEVAILRRFGALNAQNLLYLQAELTGLEQKLRQLAIENESSLHPDNRVYSRDWETLSNCGVTDTGDDSQWRTMLRIREVLKQYNEAILLQSVLAKHKKPRPRDVRFLQEWMDRPSMGNVYLLGPDSDTWNQPDLHDLIALDARIVEDPFSAFFSDIFLPWYHQAFGKVFRKPAADNTVIYSQAGISRVASMLSTSIACGLPVAGIAILYFVTSMVSRLAIIAAFTVGFSFCLGLVTGARRIDVFTATAAFAAVQVVFVSTNNSSNIMTAS